MCFEILIETTSYASGRVCPQSMEVSQRAEGCRDQWAGPWKTNKEKNIKDSLDNKKEKRSAKSQKH